jgi:N-acetylmuramoyl-L-alanine amidase
MKLLIVLMLVLLPLHKTIALESNKELICLAKNIYFEARGEPRAGKLAVAQVTLNRVKSTKYRNTICGVVYEKKQFSWTATYNKKHIKNYEAWIDAIAIAQETLENGKALKNFPALFFHNHTIKPKWASQKRKVAKIGNHTFYV